MAYSKIDEQHVERVRKASTLYEVLAVEKTSNESDLKKSYRRLALLLHPDKNKAPGANEAFKAVSKAYVVLSDPQKRADYDRTGDWRTADNRRSQPSSTQMNGFNMWFEDEDDDFLAQNFFHMFFTGEIPDLDRMSRLRRSDKIEHLLHFPRGFLQSHVLSPSSLEKKETRFCLKFFGITQKFTHLWPSFFTILKRINLRVIKLKHILFKLIKKIRRDGKFCNCGPPTGLK